MTKLTLVHKSFVFIILTKKTDLYSQEIFFICVVIKQSHNKTRQRRIKKYYDIYSSSLAKIDIWLKERPFRFTINELFTKKNKKNYKKLAT